MGVIARKKWKWRENFKTNKNMGKFQQKGGNLRKNGIKSRKNGKKVFKIIFLLLTEEICGLISTNRKEKFQQRWQKIFNKNGGSE